MNENIMISVIIPVYNTGSKGYLARCLDSILKNTYKNLEIICINDGSTDNSLEVLNKYKSVDSRIVIINQKNAGVSAARNAGIERANGNFIAFIDSDDWIDKMYFQELINSAIQEKADMVLCGYVESNGEQRTESKNFKPYKSSCMLGKDFFGIKAESWMRGFIWGRLYKRSLIADNRFSEELSVMEDNMFNIDVISKKVLCKIAILDHELYFRFNRPGSLSQTLNSDEWIELSKKFITKSIEKASNLPDAYKKYLLFETFKKSLRLRWHVAFYQKEVKNNVNAIVKRNYQRLTCLENVSWKEKGLCWVLFRFPQVYRLYLINKDKEFLIAEQRKKDTARKNQI